jgi:hypothetical protein
MHAEESRIASVCTIIPLARPQTYPHPMQNGAYGKSAAMLKQKTTE